MAGPNDFHLGPKGELLPGLNAEEAVAVAEPPKTKDLTKREKVLDAVSAKLAEDRAALEKEKADFDRERAARIAAGG